MDDGQSLVTGLDFRGELHTAVEADGRSRSRRGAAGFRQVVLRVPRVDPLRWLAAQTYAERIFWSGRSGGETMAGLGCVAVVESEGPVDYTRMRRDMSQILGRARGSVRLFGGIRFGERDMPDPGWSAFPSYRFVLPRFELRTGARSSLLTCNIAPGESVGGGALTDEIQALESPLPELVRIPRTVARTDTPGRRDWIRDIEWALEAFSSTTLAKVVLARRASFEFESDLDPFALMARLRSSTPSCYHFIMSRGDATFLGATPERLFRQDGRRIESEAVAGTGARGATEGDDLLLSDELLHSEKDQREHEYVRQSIKEALTDLTRMLHVDTTASDMKLSVGRHLVSRVEGILESGVDAFDLLARLHPTPAVGGYPHREAIDVIEHLESFDRGWYAGPVGWIGPDAAEFAVGIRSGRVIGRTLDLYSGAGIVCGSDPGREWKEVEQKIGDFVRALST